MEKGIAGAGLDAAHRILDSGHVALSVFVVLTAILLICMIVMFRFFDKQLKYQHAELEKKDIEIARLTNVVIEIQRNTASAINGIGGVIRSYEHNRQD